jgi:2-polyprenyl-3-methyl-5-hydroxy-6-metoxy-1,4-benzoquinol methylase
MQGSGWTVTGLEPDAAAVRRAKDLYGLKFQSPSGLANLPSNSFNAVTMWHVLEHVHDLHGSIEKIKDILVNNGVLIIAVPNYTSFDATAYQQYWAAYDVPDIYIISLLCRQVVDGKAWSGSRKVNRCGMIVFMSAC